MKIIDGLILSRTKLKTHRIRDGISVVVCSLLFAILFFGAFVVAGVLQSAAKYQDYGFNGHFYTSTTQNSMISLDDPAYEHARAMANADLEKRSIKVTDKIIESQEYLWHTSELAMQEIEQRSRDDFAKYVDEVNAKYHPTKMYNFRSIGALDYDAKRIAVDDADPLLTTMRDAMAKGTLQNLSQGTTVSWDTPTFNTIETEFAKPMLAAGQTTDAQSGEPTPIFMPFRVVATMDGASTSNLSPEDQNKLHQDLAAKYAGQTVSYCYRNAAAQTQLTAALQYNDQLVKDKSKAAPITINDCAPIDQAQYKAAKLDTAAESTDENGEKLLFPKPEIETETPQTARLTFRIVGFVPTSADPYDTSMFAYLQTAVNTWPGYTQQPMIIPTEAVAKNAVLAEVVSAMQNTPYLMFDFGSRADQRAYIDSSCTENCYDSSKPTVVSFGNIKVVLEDVVNSSITVVLIFAGVIAAVALVIEMAIIGKTIGESRREIAVFRALGARRGDISQIYFGFGLWLAMRSLIWALVIAIGGAIAMTYFFADDLNAVLMAAVGAYNSPESSYLIGFDWLWLIAITAVLIVSAAVGMAIPIAANLRKKLINQLREE